MDVAYLLISEKHLILIGIKIRHYFEPLIFDLKYSLDWVDSLIPKLAMNKTKGCILQNKLKKFTSGNV